MPTAQRAYAVVGVFRWGDRREQWNFRERFRLITDVASVKSSVERASRGLSSFIGSHPIAGSERSGPDAAQSDIFVGKPWAYCVPPGADDERAHTALLTLIACLGGKPQAISAAEHDAIVALSSHLPQYLSSALGSLVGEHDLHGLNGTGLASMLRLARSNWPMWRGIFVENGPHIAATLRIFAERALADAEALETGNTGALGGRFAEGSAASFALCPDLAPRETAPKR